MFANNLKAIKCDKKFIVFVTFFELICEQVMNVIFLHLQEKKKEGSVM